MAIDVRQRALAGGALAYRLGTMRRFGLADIGRQGQIRGWAQPEEGHSWNDGLEAVLDLILPAMPGRACTIIVRGAPYCPRAASQQDVTLFGNGFRLGFWRLLATSSDTLSAVIEPEQWVRRGDSARLSCLWFLPNSARPVDLGEVDDQRQLGFCFRSVQIAEIEG